MIGYEASLLDQERERARVRRLRARYGWRWWRLDRYKWTRYTPGATGQRPRIGRSCVRRVMIYGPAVDAEWARRRFVAGRPARLAAPATLRQVERVYVGPYEEEYAGRVPARWWRRRLVEHRERRGRPRPRLYWPHPLQRGRGR